MQMNENDKKLVRDHGFVLDEQALLPLEGDYYSNDRHLMCEDGRSVHVYYYIGTPVDSDAPLGNRVSEVCVDAMDGSMVRYKVDNDDDKLAYALSMFSDDCRAMDFDDLAVWLDEENTRRREENDAKVLALCETADNGFDAQTYLDVVNSISDAGISVPVRRAMLEHDLFVSNSNDVDGYRYAYVKEYGCPVDASEFYMDDSEARDRIRQCKALTTEATSRLDRMRDMLLDTSRLGSVPRAAELPGMEGRVVSAVNDVDAIGNDVNAARREVFVLYKAGDSEQDDAFGGWLVECEGEFESGNYPNPIGETEMGSARFEVSVRGVSVAEARQLDALADRSAEYGIAHNREGGTRYGDCDVWHFLGDADVRNKFANVSFNASNVLHEESKHLDIRYPRAADAPLDAMREQFEAGQSFAMELEERNKALSELSVDSSAGGYDKGVSYADECGF